LSVQLFANGVIRAPLFSYVEDAAGSMADMMALYGLNHMATISGLRSHFEVVPLIPPSVTLTAGDVLTCYGYPNVADEPTWPYVPARSAKGNFLRVGDAAGNMIEASVPTEEGFSGGPVFTEAGVFVGMLIGETSGVARIVSGKALAFL
jgi:hypothetical protein